MTKLTKGILIGTIAGIIDVVPMIIQKLDWYACCSAFIHWVILGTIFPYLTWNLRPWLKGFLLATVSALPVMLIVLKEDPIAIIPIGIFSAVLGILLGISSDKFITRSVS